MQRRKRSAAHSGSSAAAGPTCAACWMRASWGQPLAHSCSSGAPAAGSKRDARPGTAAFPFAGGRREPAGCLPLAGGCLGCAFPSIGLPLRLAAAQTSNHSPPFDHDTRGTRNRLRAGAACLAQRPRPTRNALQCTWATARATWEDILCEWLWGAAAGGSLRLLPSNPVRGGGGEGGHRAPGQPGRAENEGDLWGELWGELAAQGPGGACKASRGWEEGEMDEWRGAEPGEACSQPAGPAAAAAAAAPRCTAAGSGGVTANSAWAVSRLPAGSISNCFMQVHSAHQTAANRGLPVAGLPPQSGAVAASRRRAAAGPPPCCSAAAGRSAGGGRATASTLTQSCLQAQTAWEWGQQRWQSISKRRQRSSRPQPSPAAAAAATSRNATRAAAQRQPASQPPSPLTDAQVHAEEARHQHHRGHR